jgi:molybdopterin molybdotransferase
MSGLTSFAAAVAWIDREFGGPPAAETVPLGDALRRVVAADVVARRAAPPFDRAALDGWAVRAEETLGASLYNPVLLPARPIACGMRLPPGADAVIPLEAAQRSMGGTIEIVEPVAGGADVERGGDFYCAGAVVLPAGRPIGAAQLGLLAEAGIEVIAAVRRPRVRLVVAAGDADAATPMLAAFVARDGGIVEIHAADDERAAPDVDLVLILGGTGQGEADTALRAAAGRMAIHGVALRPGSFVALGHAGSVPLFLLPRGLADCLWAYELLAGRAVRRSAGRPPGPPYAVCELAAARKIVSAVGYAEVRPVRLAAGAVEPVAGSGLFAAAGEADGFVVVPEASEGIPPGSRVPVYLYDRHGE